MNETFNLDMSIMKELRKTSVDQCPHWMWDKLAKSPLHPLQPCSELAVEVSDWSREEADFVRPTHEGLRRALLCLLMEC